MNVAPSDSTSVLDAGRTSYPLTTAPSRRAVPMACRPATPAPSTSTLAGRAVPAAVISSGKNRPNSAAATSAALYPATLAWELSASIGWVLVSVRGIRSRLIAVTPSAASAAASSGWTSGASMPITAWPGRSRPTTPADGLVTVRMTSASRYSSAALTMVAPASA